MQLGQQIFLITSNRAMRAIALVLDPLRYIGPLACGAMREPCDGVYDDAARVRSRRFLSLFFLLNCCSLSLIMFV